MIINTNRIMNDYKYQTRLMIINTKQINDYTYNRSINVIKTEKDYLLRDRIASSYKGSRKHLQMPGKRHPPANPSWSASFLSSRDLPWQGHAVGRGDTRETIHCNVKCPPTAASGGERGHLRYHGPICSPRNALHYRCIGAERPCREGVSVRSTPTRGHGSLRQASVPIEGV